MIDAFDVRHYDSLGSTMDEARHLAAQGAPSGTVVHADEQVAGRGRRARGWISPAGNLYLSIILRTGLPANRTPEISFLTAVAVCETLTVFLPRDVAVRLKWPNDVLVNGGKIAGILLEQAEDAVIVGIGVNILIAPSVNAYNTTSVLAHGGIATVDGARDILLDRFQRLINLWHAEGFEPIRSFWIARSYPIGSPIQVQTGADLISGSFLGLDSDGGLLLESDEGRRRILAADIVSTPL